MEKSKTAIGKRSRKQNVKVTPFNFEYLSRILSPLEMVAYSRNYKVFTYQIDDKVFLISKQNALLLKRNIDSKIKMIQGIIPMPICQPQKKINTNQALFITKEISRSHLPISLKMKLKKCGLTYFSDIIHLGIHCFSKLEKITLKDIELVFNLCAKHKWLDVFLKEVLNETKVDLTPVQEKS